MPPGIRSQNAEPICTTTSTVRPNKSSPSRIPVRATGSTISRDSGSRSARDARMCGVAAAAMEPGQGLVDDGAVAGEDQRRSWREFGRYDSVMWSKKPWGYLHRLHPPSRFVCHDATPDARSLTHPGADRDLVLGQPSVSPTSAAEVLRSSFSSIASSRALRSSCLAAFEGAESRRPNARPRRSKALPTRPAGRSR